MLLFKEKKKSKIINTGHNLPKATANQQWNLIVNWDKIIPVEVIRQTKKTGNVIYGCRAVNAIVGDPWTRATHDFDIYSLHPLRHAVEMEQAIDRRIGADIAHVEIVPYEDKEGKSKTVYRVVTKPLGDPVVDYTFRPSGIQHVTIGGIRYETLKRAEAKYHRMFEQGLVKRIPKAQTDLIRIEGHRIEKLLKIKYPKLVDDRR